MAQKGYYRFPDVRNDSIVFVSEDDLWQVNLKGGTARRMTANLGQISYPKISPDGKWIVFASVEEGYSELYIMEAMGGFQKRLTFLGAMSVPLEWSADSQYIYFASNFLQAFDTGIFKISMQGGEPEKVPVGYANRISHGEKGVVIGRHVRDTARWKRYKGGTAGEFWIAEKDSIHFKKLFDLKANVDSPMFIGARIYFISDKEGIANVYSCNTDGKDIKRHTDHDEFYVRNANTDGKNIVYHAGGDLYLYDITKEKVKKLDILYHSSQTQTNRKFIEADKYLQGYSIHPDGTHIAVGIRGKIAAFGNWAGPVTQYGKKNGVRYRLPTWLIDGKTIAATTDELNGEDRIILFNTEEKTEKILNKINVGIVKEILPSPKENKIVITNHRNEMMLIDCDTQTSIVLDSSDFGRIYGVDWSPDGKWICYDFAPNASTYLIKLVEVETKKTHEISEPILHDSAPAFSSDGKYIYFVGDRIFYPVYDGVQFELSFIKPSKLYAIPLAKETKSPFFQEPKPFIKDEKKSDAKEEEIAVKIDLENITSRIVEFPMKATIIGGVGEYKNKVFYMEYPRDCVEEEDEEDWWGEEKPKWILKMYDIEKQQEETILEKISGFYFSKKRDAMIIRQGGALTVLKTGEKPNKDAKKKFSSEDGKIALNRIRLDLLPREEWKQMYREAWLLQREHFWTENMSNIDWEKVYKRYEPLLERVGSRSEFSDVIWEMQGELGTSHCYEFGGDYRPHPHFPMGKLGCKYELSQDGTYYIFKEIYNGAAGNETEISPLLAPGINLQAGAHLLAINGQKVDKETHPKELLVNLAGQEVELTVRENDKTRNVVVKTLKLEQNVLYRQWVEKNKEYVHQKSNGKLGYIHIPDMGMKGFSEFHRNYLTECRYDGMVVDVRYNGGGHVSQLLLEKLNRKIIGYDATRWNKEPESYPSAAVAGPLLAITNEYAGSDGDIFSHCFKLMKLGKLIGKRTWGGVIGINGQYSLADGTITTQPEYSFWFKDVGWNVENYGTDPDIEVEILPQDYVNGNDPQLDKAIELLLEELTKNPVKKPVLDNRPNLALPKLPKRN
jgi:tricorn protease